MSESVERIRQTLLSQISRDHPNWAMSTLQFFSSGLDFLVFKGTCRYGDVAVRIPRCRWISNDNDVCQDSRQLLRQEARFGEVTAVIDWSNALVGDPALELARVAEYGHLEAGFVHGYESTGRMGDSPREVEIVYRLDAAVMLAIVFLSENQDPSRSTRQVKRIVDLCNAMRSCH